MQAKTQHNLETIRVLSLDAMNTMIKPKEPVGDVYARFAQEIGIYADPEKLTSNCALAFRTVWDLKPYYALGSGGAELWWREVVRRSFETLHPSVIDRLAKTIFEYYATTEPWKLIEKDLYVMLKRMREQGIKIVVTSNFDPRLRSLLDSFGIAQQIDWMLLSGEQGVQKPEREIFARIQRHFELENPQQMLHVGDSYELDYRAARAFGAKSLLFGQKEQLNRDSGNNIPSTDTIASLSELFF